MTHIIRDNFAAPELMRSLAATWLPRDCPHWHVYDNGKLATKDSGRIPTAGRLLLQSMASLPIGEMLGVADTFPDIEYLHGAGLHQIDAGGFLGLHLDSERHPLLPWRREASAILYVDDCDGGELELCDSSGVTTDRIEVVENRLVIFATPVQWHRVVDCRSVRRSLCLFWWSIDATASGNTRANFIQTPRGCGPVGSQKPPQVPIAPHSDCAQ